MKKPIPVYTAIFGGYDEVQLTQPNDNRFKTTILNDFDSIGVSIITPTSNLALSQKPFSQQNRYFKYNPPDSLVENSDVHVYIDGSLKILDFDLLYSLCKKLYDSEYDIVMPESKNNNNMLLECLLAVRTGKADVTQVYRQVHRYTEKGFKDVALTVSAGFQIRRTNSKALHRFLDKWYFEITKWQTRDQIAYPYVLWRTGYKRVRTFGNNTRDKLFKKMPHAGEIDETALSL
jgi:hypothetical protein